MVAATDNADNGSIMRKGNHTGSGWSSNAVIAARPYWYCELLLWVFTPAWGYNSLVQKSRELDLPGQNVRHQSMSEQLGDTWKTVIDCWWWIWDEPGDVTSEENCSPGAGEAHSSLWRSACQPRFFHAVRPLGMCCEEIWFVRDAEKRKNWGQSLCEAIHDASTAKSRPFWFMPSSRTIISMQVVGYLYNEAIILRVQHAWLALIGGAIQG